jgi:hypothetical protein
MQHKVASLDMELNPERRQHQARALQLLKANLEKQVSTLKFNIMLGIMANEKVSGRVLLTLALQGVYFLLEFHTDTCPK